MIHLALWLVALSILIPLTIIAVMVLGFVGLVGAEKLKGTGYILLVAALLVLGTVLFGVKVLAGFGFLAILDELFGWSKRLISS